MTGFRSHLECHQLKVYFAAMVLAAIVALIVPGANALEIGINPALALMLFATFLQIPFAELGRAFADLRFLAVLLITNFLVMPILVAILMLFPGLSSTIFWPISSCRLPPASKGRH